MIDTGRIIMHEMVYIKSQEKCLNCDGTGKTTIYRNDLEEFEEIECIKCATEKTHK